MLSVVALLGADDVNLLPVRPVTDSYFGTQVVDPYRYLEAGGPDIQTWQTSQLDATAAMIARARKIAGFDAPAAPSKAGAKITNLTLVRGHLYYLESALGVDRVIERGLRPGSAERVVASSEQFNGAAGPASLGVFALSSDAKLLAIHVYAGDKSASDIRVLRVKDGSTIETPLHGTIYDYIGFTHDDEHVIYARAARREVVPDFANPDISYDCVHRLGTAQSSDTIIFGQGVSPLVDVPPRAFAFVDVSGAQAVAEVRDPAAVGSRFYAAPMNTLGKPKTPWRPLGSASDGYTDYAVHGNTIDFTTAKDAPNFKVVRASLSGPLRPHVVFPASDSVVVSGTLDGIPKAGIFALNAAADADYVQLLDRGLNRMVRIPYVAGAKPLPVSLPLAGSILQVAVDAKAPGAALELTSWTDPGDVYHFDPARGPAVALGVRHAGADPNRVAMELNATAPDGTVIPVSLVAQRDVALDHPHPLLLRVAGAYGFSFTPDYTQVPDAWLAHGGIFAVAHVRGGGELGEAWHRAGMGARKSNTWNDLIAAAQMLVDKGYTVPKELNLYGTTQSYLGGIASSVAIGRAIEERPDLFAAAVVDAPVFDMVRSERTQLGRQSASEFGSIATESGFAALLAMSPYEHVKTGVAYPPVLIRSLSHFGLGDDWQAAKMVARLQAAQGLPGAAYLDIFGGSKADHRTRADLRTDAYAFFLYEDTK